MSAPIVRARTCRVNPPVPIGRAIASSTGQYFEQVVVAPAGFEAFGLDAARGGRLLLEEGERQAAQDREVLGGLADPHAALILAEGPVEQPMHLGPDAPIRTHPLAESLSGERGAEPVR